MRRVYLEYSSGIKVSATLKEEENKEMVDSFWAAADGKKYVCIHPLAAGYVYGAIPLPTPEVPAIQPKETMRPCDAEIGDIHFNDWRMWITYGPVTESLPDQQDLVATIDEECMEEFKKASKDVFYNMYYYHKVANVILSKKED